MDESRTNINWYPGHMAKTKKQILEDLKLIDVIIEVLDARAPKASENPDVKNYCKNKKRIVVLNKSDLADENISNQWIEYYKKNNIACLKVESNTGKGIKEVVNQIKLEYKDIENKYIEKGRTGKSTRVMVLGVPNVGKSTFINKLAKRSVAKVGNKPGVTKGKQWIKIEENIELMDTPGMLWPKLDDDVLAMHLAYLNTIGQNAIDNEEIAYSLLKYLIDNYKDKIEKRYDIIIDENIDVEDNDYDQSDKILSVRDKIARKKGAILSGGRINEQKVSDMILMDFQSGKLGRISIEKP